MATILWYIEIHGKVEGPYTFEDLKKDLRLSPDTLVWRKGFEKWRLMRDVPELSDLFKDPIEKKPPDEIMTSKRSLLFDDEIALNEQREPPLFPIWFLFFLLSFTYIYFYFYYYYF